VKLVKISKAMPDAADCHVLGSGRVRARKLKRRDKKDTFKR